MKGTKKKHTGITLIVVILVIVLSLGLLARLLGGIGTRSEITVTYNGTPYHKSVSGLTLKPGAEFSVKLRDKKSTYTVKIYAAGTQETDFAFTVDGTEYDWHADIVSANGGKGEDFTDALLTSKTDSGFVISGGIAKALSDIWQDEDIVLPESIRAGDRFRLEVTSGKTTLTIGFSVEETPGVGVQGIEISPGEIIF